MFEDVKIGPNPGDAGGAIGSALKVILDKNQINKLKNNNPFLGPSYSDEFIQKSVIENIQNNKNYKIKLYENFNDLASRAALIIKEKKIIFWFQDAMEWGPRALGNRSILGDPRRADMKDILNLKIKRRESFRPFAPSILREHVKDWFELDHDVPFMLQVFQIQEARRPDIPAVTHVNGSGRLQTVTANQNQRYYQLINAFFSLTGVPIVLNTSFNENEPVVCSPKEALNCFLRTKMDVLVLGNYFIQRRSAS
jgi:carbamoyltransferase